MRKSAEVLERVYSQQPGIVTRRIAEQVILVPIKGKVADMQRIFMLNAVGDYVWRQLTENIPVKTICDLVQDNFMVTVDQARLDVCEFIGQLIDLELISEAR
jgi:hypothetical protein